jgi:Ser/Thr protein kinase RdoA (MazF antagonist)
MSTDGPLAGGTANQGRVYRVGDAVHRPRGAHSPAVHALLGHLQRQGFDGAPGVREVHARTEILDYLPGRPAIEPLEPWALTSAALTSVGVLLRRLHDHAASFDGTGLRWQRPVPERWRGSLVTHNDANPTNVIFRDGRAAALIDFDLAAPSTPEWELAVAACFWAPLREADDVPDERVDHRLSRVRLLLDGYRADRRLRGEVAAACADANRWIGDIIGEASALGHPAFGRLWETQANMYARADAWIATHREHLADAVR